jgi:preprotein translocase subunit SecG
MSFTIFLILITLVSFCLIVLIMVQNPKGGGLSSTLGGSQVVGGVQKTSDFLDKGTWTLATILIVLIMLSTLSFSNSYGGDSKYIDESAVAPAPAAAAPATGTPAPAQGEGAATPAPATAPAQQAAPQQ